MNRKQFISTLGVGAAGLMTFGCKNGVAAPNALPVFSMENPDPFWAAVRNEFPLTRERTYMNNGGMGPASSRVLRAVQAKSDELQAISETGHEIMDEVREVAADFFGADFDEICFTRSATEGNSIVAAGLKLKEGDEVIFESHAHPGGGMAWMNRQKRHGVKVKIFDPDPDSIGGNINRIEALITPKTRVIQLSHVTAPTGILFDVKAVAKLARERGIWFHIDGAQSAGMFPFNLHEIGCHSYATSGHKWMGGPRGTGVLFIAKDHMDEVECSYAGSYSGPYEFPDMRK
jgi:selenocysteine lyase/cysteine desulfurase